MSDQFRDRLHGAMNTDASRFSPAGPLGATRANLVDRLHRRQRRIVSTGVAAALLISAGVVGLAVNRPSATPARPVAVGGSGHPAAFSNPSDPSGGPAGAPGGGGASGAVSAASTTDPSGTPGGGQNHPSGPSSPPSSVAVGNPTGPTVPSTVTPVTSVPPPVSVASTTVVASPLARVRGTVRIATACPAAAPTATPCPITSTPKAGPAQVELVRADGTVAVQGNAGSDGAFTLTVAAGTYTISAQPIVATTATGQGCAATPSEVTVTPGGSATVAVSCTTAIR
jgi:hypothetical protein